MNTALRRHARGAAGRAALGIVLSVVGVGLARCAPSSDQGASSAGHTVNADSVRSVSVSLPLNSAGSSTRSAAPSPGSVAVVCVRDVGGETFAAGRILVAAVSDDAPGIGVEAVHHAITSYPCGVLSRVLDRVVVGDRIRLDSLAVGGTYDPSARTVFIALRGDVSVVGFPAIVLTCHAEISSLLLNEYRQELDEREWYSCNPGGFTYGVGGYEAIRDGVCGTRWDSRWLSRGFLCEYGTASIEEDFNSIAAYMMIGDLALDAASLHHSALGHKLELVRRFYARISPEFSAAFFERQRDLLRRAFAAAHGRR